MSRGGRGKDKTPGGRSAEQYMLLPYPMVQSDAWRSLSGHATKVWIELRSRFNGGNNGNLHLSMGEAARLLHMSKATVQRAYKELEKKGFIKLVNKGSWYGRRASEWAVTDQRYNNQPPTRDWRSWKPEAEEKRCLPRPKDQDPISWQPHMVSNSVPLQ